MICQKKLLSLLILCYQLRLVLDDDKAQQCEEILGQVKPIIRFNEGLQYAQKKTYIRKMRSTQLGAINIFVESGMDTTGTRVFPAEFQEFAPRGKSFAFDTIWDVTKRHYIKNQQRLEIQQALPFRISTGSISNLYKEGLAYIRACHEGAIEQLREYYNKKNQVFILQMDGTNEGGKCTHFQVREAHSGHVLLAKRIPTENQVEIEAILKEVEECFGRPDAVISDMSGKGIAAVKGLWGEAVPLFICQFHFLRDIGKDMLGSLHENLRKCFASSHITAELNDLRKRFLNNSRKYPSDKKHFFQGIAIIDWILDYKSTLSGEAFPFDLPWKTYFERCFSINRQIDQIFKKTDREYSQKATQVLSKIQKKLHKLLKPIAHTRRYYALKTNAQFFLEIRSIFWDDKEDTSAPLSRNATASKDAVTPPDQLQKKIQSMADKLKDKAQTAKNKSLLIKAAIQLEKYKSKLSNHLASDGHYYPLPRTNNLCEITFRELKRTIRRTNGKKNLARVFDHTPAEIILLQNLQDEDYCRIVFKERPIHEAFAQIPPEAVKNILKDMNTDVTKKVINPIIKHPDFLILNKEYFTLCAE